MKWFKGLSQFWRMYIYGLTFGVIYSFVSILLGIKLSFGINLLVLFLCCILITPFISKLDNKYIARKENDIWEQFISTH